MAVDYIKRLAGPYTGAGQKTFTFSFLIFTEEDVYVAVANSNESNPSNLNFGTDYTVSMNADQQSAPGGSITLSVALTQGQILVIGSAVDYTQTLDLTNYTRFPPERITKELDRIVVQIQQLVEITGRVLTVPATSSTTPAEMIEQLLAAQQEAQQYANAAAASAEAAEASKDEAAEILEGVEQAAESAEQLVPMADDLADLAGIKDEIQDVSEAKNSVTVVAADLDVTYGPASLDYGVYGKSGALPQVTGGNIVVVATYIDAVRTVALNMSSILAIEDKIDGLDATIAEMEDQVSEAQTAASNASSSATAAAGSSTSAATQANLAKDWAVKMDGKIVENGAEVDYSAKYYANVAAGYADDASAVLTQVTQAGTTAVGNVQDAQETAVQAVGTAQTAATSAVSTAQSQAVSAVQSQQTTSVNAVNSAGATQTANAKAQADAAALSATAAETAKTQAETAKTDAQTAKTQAETAAGTATTKASEAAQSATDAGNAKTAALNAQTAAETAQAAAEAARDAAEDVAESLGDPLGKDEAAQTYLSKSDASTTYATKAEMTSGLAGKANTAHTHTHNDVTGLGSLAIRDLVGAADLAQTIDLGVYGNA